MTSSKNEQKNEKAAQSDDDDGVQIYETTGARRGLPKLSRRDALRLGAGAAGAAALPVGGQILGKGPVGEAEAAAPAVAAGAVAGGAVVAWAASGTADAPTREEEERQDVEEYEEAINDAVHQDIYNNIDNQKNVEETLKREYEHVIESPGERGALGGYAWSVIRNETWSCYEEGLTENEALTEVTNAFREFISDRLEDFAEEWNSYAREIEYERYNAWRRMFTEPEWDESTIYVDGDNRYTRRSDHSFPDPSQLDIDPEETTGEDLDEMDDFPDFEEFIQYLPRELPDGRETRLLVVPQEFRRGHTYDYEHITWPGSGGAFETDYGTGTVTENDEMADLFEGHNGEEAYYAAREYNPDWDPARFTVDTSRTVEIEDPYESEQHIDIHDVGDFWGEVVNTTWDYYEEVVDEIPDYVSGVYEQFETGQADPDDILTAQDYVDEYGDDEFSRAVAEMVFAGFEIDLDLETKVKVTDPTNDEEPDEGALMLDYNINRLWRWEYETEPIDGPEVTITIEDESIEEAGLSPGDDAAENSDVDDDATAYMDWAIEVEYDGETETKTVSLSDLDSDGTATVEFDETPDDLDVYRDFAAFQIVSTIPEGEEIPLDDVNSALLLKDYGEGVEWVYLEEEGYVELVEVLHDERDALRYTRWVERDGVPERSNDRRQRETEARETTQEVLVEMKDDATGGGGGGGGVFDGDSGAVATILGGVAAVLFAFSAAAAAVTGGGEDR
ncbi:hypothetical protein [Natrarchaeobaculum sulfurireducens]|uniref:Envelope protein N-terminal domain-containing protein n=1 Tax=Natrarchaeobaculum sulfurireducens TaxID=2044521 RepID=A0A346PQL5_9EURY|nr:hypothetical protein [Natrarchaeobaculum sulfurireducens]AXR81810.1 hypothetical protein AArcMg_1802 [Natrarchaeobaculum sulfurireducens]